MTRQQQSDLLNFFSRVAFVAQRRFGDSVWTRYPAPTTSVWDSLGVFLEGYAFERQGSAPDFRAVAADVVAELRLFTPSPSQVWQRFQAKLGSRPLNIKNNPLAPKGTSLTGGSLTSGKSAVELANELATPLVQWALLGLNENKTADVHAKIREITGVDYKIASLFLRDVAVRYRVYPSTSRWLLQPIDVWVRRSAALLGALGDDEAASKFIVQAAQTENYEPETVNQGMWYFGSEIAGSEYRLTQALANLNQAEDLLKRHLRSLTRAARSDSSVVAAVRWAKHGNQRTVPAGLDGTLSRKRRRKEEILAPMMVQGVPAFVPAKLSYSHVFRGIWQFPIAELSC
jgi:hypothetical protein